MSANFVKALCGAHKVALVAVADHDPEDWWACPICGRGDTRQNVLREVGEHTKEVAARHLQEQMRDVARKSKFMTFKGATIPQRSYRFVVNLKL